VSLVRKVRKTYYGPERECVHCATVIRDVLYVPSQIVSTYNTLATPLP